MRDEFDEAPRRRPPDNSGTNAVKVVLIVLGTIFVVGFCLVAALVGVTVYGVRQAGKAISKSLNEFDSELRCTQAAQALKSYHDRNGHFPPPALPTRDGQPGLSWRVAILPELGLDHLYRQFKLDRPWNDPDNMRLAEQCPPAFLPPGQSYGSTTHLRVFVGAGSMFQYGKKARLSGGNPGETVLIADGLSRTLAFVEASGPVLWIQPDELPFTPGGKVPELGPPQRDWYYAATADGVIHKVRKDLPPRRLEAAITAAGGESIGLE